ncbi:MAG: polyprenol monophosphomannose synthase [Patescibacteria group bacterium]|nr:polyprenol monophosphomannose synthase [Patescibacteria group bacterium]
MPKIYIVIPTYNEKNNIVKLLDLIFRQSIEGLNVLVVDDNSPDGTGDVVDGLRAGNLRLNILHRHHKDGLGRAYIDGFKLALTAGADLILEMDADLSHDPKYLPAILAAATKFDLVIGSRYIKGGGVANWNMARRLISRFGNLYARVILGLSVRDLTGGYKCYHRQVLENIGLDDLSSVGYNFQIETTYQALRAGFRVGEVPIVFVERAEGQSKFSLGIMLESFWKVFILKYKSRVTK